MSVVTKTGDKGDTGLLSGERISKTDPRVEAYGSLDELVSQLGVVRSFLPTASIATPLKKIQSDLFRLGAELASTKLDPRWKVVPINASDVEQLEKWVHKYEPELKLPPQFVLPGGSPASAFLDVARTVARRLERRIVFLCESEKFGNKEAIRYINRLSDFLFVLARYEQKQAGLEYEPV